MRLLPVPFDSAESLEETFSREAASVCAALDRFVVPAFAEAVPACF